MHVLHTASLSSSNSAIVKTGLDTVLNNSEGVYTVFAPTNAAFDAPADHDQAGLDLADRVKFHIGRGVLKTDRVIDGDKMDSLLGGRFVTFNTYTKKDKVCIVTERLKRPDRDQCT